MYNFKNLFMQVMVLICFLLIHLNIASAQAGKPPIRREEQTLTEMKPVQGTWDVQKNVTIDGRVFDIAGTMTVDSEVNRDQICTVVFANRDDYTIFEAWVGFHGGGGRGTNQFVVLGDGVELYKSPKMRESDSAIKVSVSIKGCKGITLRTFGSEDINHYNTAVWGEPKFIKGQISKVEDNLTMHTNGDVTGGKVLRLDPEKLKELAEKLKTKVEKDPDLSKSKPTLAIAPFKLIPAETLAHSNIENVREDLSTALIDAEAFEVVERGQLDKALKELKLDLDDTFDSDNAQRLGKLARARTVLIGSISDRGTYTVINARLIDTETGKCRIAASVELRQ